MNKIQTLSTRLRFIFQVAFYLIPLLSVIYWVTISENLINHLSLTTMPLESVALTPSSRLLALLITAIPMGILMFIFYQLAYVFKNYTKGLVFCLENAQTYKKIGLALFMLALANFLTDPLISVVLSHQAVGEQILSIGLGVGQVYPVIFGLALYIISFIMEEAHRIDQEQKYTI